MRGDEVRVEAGSEQSGSCEQWGTNNALIKVKKSTYLIFLWNNNAKTKNKPYLAIFIHATFTSKRLKHKKNSR